MVSSLKSKAISYKLLAYSQIESVILQPINMPDFFELHLYYSMLHTSIPQKPHLICQKLYKTLAWD